MTRPRILLLCGGRSEEHDVSLASATSLIEAVQHDFDLTPIVIGRDGRFLSAAASLAQLAAPQLAPAQENAGSLSPDLSLRESVSQTLSAQQFDVIFPLLHGPYGEDGTVQGLCRMLGLPFVGSDVLASAVGMDKGMMKRIFAAHQLPQVPFEVFTRAAWQQDPHAVQQRLAALGYPLFIKPANLGSSVGISKVHSAAELAAAVTNALRHDRRIVAEKGLEHARELEVGVLGNEDAQVSVVGEITFAGSFYDYENKYTDGHAEMHIPADVPESIAKSAQELALKAFAAIDAAGLARVDFFLHAGQLYLNEVNTMPGFTRYSMYPKLWEASGVGYAQLIHTLVALALTKN